MIRPVRRSQWKVEKGRVREAGALRETKPGADAGNDKERGGRRCLLTSTAILSVAVSDQSRCRDRESYSYILIIIKTLVRWKRVCAS